MLIFGEKKQHSSVILIKYMKLCKYTFSAKSWIYILKNVLVALFPYESEQMLSSSKQLKKKIINGIKNLSIWPIFHIIALCDELNIILKNTP